MQACRPARSVTLDEVSAISQLRIPLWRESRIPLEHAALMRDPVLRGEGVAHGDEAPVLLVPGFLAGDPSLRLMAHWLRRIGHRPARARMRVNVDCTARALDRLEAELEQLADAHGRQVSIVGQSRGGSMARVLAVRRPDLVERIVCLGSPITDQFAIHPLVRAQVTAVGLLGTLGVPGLFAYGCGHGACCATAREQVTAPFPDEVAFTSVYSRSDGIVDWRACLDPAAEQIEVRASHIGMAVNPHVFRAVATALAPAPARRARVARAASRPHPPPTLGLVRLRPVQLLVAALAAACLVAAPAAAQDARPQVLVVGDSLAVGTHPYLGKLLEGSDLTWDARSGRTTPQGMQALRRALADREADDGRRQPRHERRVRPGPLRRSPAAHPLRHPGGFVHRLGLDHPAAAQGGLPRAQPRPARPGEGGPAHDDRQLGRRRRPRQRRPTGRTAPQPLRLPLPQPADRRRRPPRLWCQRRRRRAMTRRAGRSL